MQEKLFETVQGQILSGSGRFPLPTTATGKYCRIDIISE